MTVADCAVAPGDPISAAAPAGGRTDLPPLRQCRRSSRSAFTPEPGSLNVERELIQERIRSGIAAAKARGKRLLGIVFIVGGILVLGDVVVATIMSPIFIGICAIAGDVFGLIRWRRDSQGIAG